MVLAAVPMAHCTACGLVSGTESEEASTGGSCIHYAKKPTCADGSSTCATARLPLLQCIDFAVGSCPYRAVESAFLQGSEEEEDEEERTLSGEVWRKWCGIVPGVGGSWVDVPGTAGCGTRDWQRHAVELGTYQPPAVVEPFLDFIVYRMELVTFSSSEFPGPGHLLPLLV